MAKGRLLRKTFGGFYFLDNGSAPPTFSGGSGWELAIEPGAAPVDDFNYVWRTDYFDLQGYVEQEETVFIQTVDWQDFQNFYSALSQVWPIQRIQIVSTEPVTREDLFQTTLNSAGVQWSYPGCPESKFDLGQIIAGKHTQYEKLGDGGSGGTGYATPTGINMTGAGNATAGSRLYLTQAVRFRSGIAQYLYYPDTACVVPIAVDKEEDLEYIFRNVRSHELQRSDGD